MSNFKRLSHSVWYCTYHIVFCPKYRYRVLKGKTEAFVRNQLYQLVGQKDGVVIEAVNVQSDHVHLILSLPPKYSVSNMMGFLKGKVAIRLFDHQKELTKRYWGKHFWARGYCVSTVGLNEAQIKRYVCWQQDQQRKG